MPQVLPTAQAKRYPPLKEGRDGDDGDVDALTEATKQYAFTKRSIDYSDDILTLTQHTAHSIFP